MLFGLGGNNMCPMPDSGVFAIVVKIVIISSMDYRLFAEMCLEALQIKRPVDFQVVNSHSVIEPAGDCCEGYCISEARGHTVVVATGGSRCVYSLIAHELTHAAVYETHPKAAWHGYVFRNTARYLESYLLENGFTLSESVYLPDVDH